MNQEKYLRVIDGVIVYPYNITELSTAYPNTSFPSVLSAELLESYRIYSVLDSVFPSYNSQTEVVKLGTPIAIDGLWYEQYIVETLSAEVLELRLQQSIAEQCSDRDALLSATDWYIIKALETGIAAPQAILDYRQELRNITQQQGFPYSISWPTLPI